MRVELVQPLLVTVAACLLSSCAGLAVPITRKVPPADSAMEIERYRAFYDKPRDMAIYRIAQWNSAIANLQAANGVSVAGQSAMAGVVTYRVARDLSHPATALLAATGFYGGRLSDAFVQVSRINAYSAGIEGLECAIAAYGTVPNAADLTRSISDKNDFAGRAELVQEVRMVQARTQYALDGAMVLAVSRITRKVDAALMGSLVTAASQGSTWNSAFSSGEAKASSKQAGMMARGDNDSDVQKQARGQLQDLLERSLVLESEVEMRRAQIDACDIAAPDTRIDRASSPLSLDLLGESSPVKIKAGGQSSVRVQGGTPPFAATVLGSNPGKIAVAVGNAGFTTIDVPSGATPGDYRVAFTDTTPGGGAKILVVTVLP